MVSSAGGIVTGKAYFRKVRRLPRDNSLLKLIDDSVSYFGVDVLVHKWLLCWCSHFCESYGLSKNDGDKKPKGMRRMVIGRLRRRVPKSPAMDAAQTRHEDNFGIPLDALDETPPVGIPSSDSDSEAASQPRQRPHLFRATVGTARSASQRKKGSTDREDRADGRDAPRTKSESAALGSLAGSAILLAAIADMGALRGTPR